MQRRRRRNRGITLIEILVGVLIISTLNALAVPEYLSTVQLARSRMGTSGARVMATEIQANYMRLNAQSYLNVISATGTDATGGTLTTDLGGACPTNPCDGGGSAFSDYTFTVSASTLTVVAKNTNSTCLGLTTYSLNGP